MTEQPDADGTDDLRASIERTRAQLAATAEAIAARLAAQQPTSEPAPAPEPTPKPAPEPAPEPAAVVARPANLPVLYRPGGDTKRAVAIAGALGAALFVAVRIGRRFLR